MLTLDQRWLLLSIGGWAIRDCLIGPAGVDHLMSSMYGGTGSRVEDGPAFLAGGFQCGNGRIVAPMFGDPVVTVTKAQLLRFSRSLPQSVTDELRAGSKAMHAERQRTWEWCRCPYEHTAPNPHSGVCRSYHPTDQQVDQHYAELRRLDAWQDQVVFRNHRADDRRARRSPRRCPGQRARAGAGDGNPVPHGRACRGLPLCHGLEQG